MSIRWRKSGKLVCGAKSLVKKGDTYINDRLHYQLAVIEKVLIPDKYEKKNGIWYWKTIQ
jgi:hypothetical protein